MPRVTGFLRVLRGRDRWGRPVDPGYGVDEGDFEGGPDHGFNPDYPDQGFDPNHPDHRFNPDYPDQGLPGGGGRPGFGYPGPAEPSRSSRPSWSGTASDWPVRSIPVGASRAADRRAIFRFGRLAPSMVCRRFLASRCRRSIRPRARIWPPLPPGTKPGKALALVAIKGVGYRYVVITIAPPAPGQGLPGSPGAPGQGLPPGSPGAPSQGLPGEREPKRG